jgi:hypothetical protein
VRAPKTNPLQGLRDGVRAQQTLGAGNVANAGPISIQTTAAAMAQQGAQSASEVGFWNDDIFTLAAAGAQDLSLTFLPIDGSEHVEISGMKTKKGTHWTRTDQTLHLLTAMGARVGELLTVEYAYLTGLAATVTHALDLNVPYGSLGWKYLNVSDAGIPSGWETTGYDDSAWPVGQAVIAHTTVPGGSYTSPYTDPGTGYVGSVAGVNALAGNPIGTTPPPLGHDGNLLIRRWLGPGTGIVVKFDAYPDFENVYVNGTFATGGSSGIRRVNQFVPADQTSNWLLAISIRVGGGATYAGFDASITGTPT